MISFARTPNLVRSGALLVGTSMVAAPAALLMVGTAANATDDCASVPGAALVAEGICEVSFTEAGSVSFQAPEGVTKISAVLVGAGGGGFADGAEAYGGGGGSIVFIDEVELSQQVEVVVGHGGEGATGSDASSGGEPSSVNSTEASGGSAASGVASGDSENHEGLFGYRGASGSGIGGVGQAYNKVDSPEPTTLDGGLGLPISAVSGSSSLFGLTTDTSLFGSGGPISVFGATAVPTSPIPGSGGAANGASGADSATAFDGADGGVYLRWATSSELAKTGFADQSTMWLLGLGGLAVTAGALALGSVRRAR